MASTSIRSTDVAFGLFLAYLSYYLHKQHKALKEVQVKGPKSPSIFFGFSKFILQTNDLQPTYDEWARKFGSVFAVPRGFGAKTLILYDPAAINHVLGQLGGKVYERPEFSRTFVAGVVSGSGLRV